MPVRSCAESRERKRVFLPHFDALTLWRIRLRSGTGGCTDRALHDVEARQMTTVRSLVLVTGNKNKAAEVAKITGWEVEAMDVKVQEIQSLSVEEVAASKALAAFAQTGRPVVVDDTGMSIEALNGLPGALVSWFLDALGPAGILGLV